MNACGVAVARLQGKSWTPIPSTDQTVNAGTVLVSPSPPASRAGGGQVHRRLMVRGWDGGLVLVGGRESRSHGEGDQRVRSRSIGMPGDRR